MKILLPYGAFFKEIPCADFRMLLTLTLLSKNGECRETRETIARLAGLARQSASCCITRLERAGYITRIHGQRNRIFLKIQRSGCEREVEIPQRFIDLLPRLNAGTVKIYCAIALTAKNGRSAGGMKEIVEFSGCGWITWADSLKILRKYGVVERSKRHGYQYFYDIVA